MTKDIRAKSAPDSDGWWWARDPKKWMPGDELCLEVIMPSLVSGFAILWHQQPYRLEHFEGFEWIKANSPFPDPQATQEADSFNQWFLNLSSGRQQALRADKWILAEAAYEAGRSQPIK